MRAMHDNRPDRGADVLVQQHLQQLAHVPDMQAGGRFDGFDERYSLAMDWAALAAQSFSAG